MKSPTMTFRFCRAPPSPSGGTVDLNGGNAKVGASGAGFGAETAGGVCQHVRGVCDGNETVEERAKLFLSKVVLCHNDLLSGNVLHAEGWNRVQARVCLHVYAF